MHRLCGVFVFVLTLLSAASAFGASLPKESRVPGGIAYVPVGKGATPPRVVFNGYRAAVFQRAEEWVAIVGIPLATKVGPQTLKVFSGDGKGADVAFAVTAKTKRKQNL